MALRIYLPIFTLINILFIDFFIPSGYAQDEEQRTSLTGDWGGLRTQLEEHGLTIESILTLELVSNTHGGAKRGELFLGNYDFTAALDTKKAGLWDNGTFFGYLIGDYGGDPSTRVGDLQVTSNIESFNTFKLYEAWYQHNFFDDRISILLGLHDYNSEFDSLNYSSFLLNSSFGMQAEIAQVGPSIFNTTSLAARIKVVPEEHLYFQSAVYDGVPGDPNDPGRTQIIFASGDGVFWGNEVGVVSTEEESESNYYKLALGHWYHTAEFEDFAERERDQNHGLYFIAEKSLYHEEDKSQGAGIFFQSGTADANRNQLHNYFGGGLIYTGLVPTRDQDVTTIGVAYARNGSDYIDLNEGAERAETAIELSYRVSITPYFTIQPDLQYVCNPGTDPNLDNALVFALRSEVAM